MRLRLLAFLIRLRLHCRCRPWRLYLGQRLQHLPKLEFVSVQRQKFERVQGSGVKFERREVISNDYNILHMERVRMRVGVRG